MVRYLIHTVKLWEMHYKTLHALEACLDTLHEDIFLDAGWPKWLTRRKIQPLPETRPVETGLQWRITYDHDETSFDRELHQAYARGRIILEHIQKMGELREQCRHKGLHLINNDIVLLGRHPVTNNNFSVFWFSHGQNYIYSDRTGYVKFRSPESAVQHIMTNNGVIRRKDEFIHHRMMAIVELHGIMTEQVNSRRLILSEYSKEQKNMAKRGFSLNATTNEFNPLEGTRKLSNSINDCYLFFDTQYKFYEIDSHGQVKKILIENTVEILLKKMLQYAKENK